VRNIVFFYVDTLRADVARDEAIVPHLTAFRAESQDYTQAYATGSDTLRSLPTITSGNYFSNQTHPGDLLQLAKQNQTKSVLIVAKSAAEFLEENLPRFVFDERRTIPDYEEGKDVWGYGANLSTSAKVGDVADDFLKSGQSKDPFLLWLFHFDVHAWRELDGEYIRSTQQAFDVPEDGKWNLRYRVVTRAIDAQFGRLLATLRETGREGDTAVVFVSDHGEALGQGGFWVHSVFLWESLVHVPLVIRLPGVAPRQVTVPVSLVDVAPTLSPILSGKSAVYHGESLMQQSSQLLDRRLPILLSGGQFTGLDRTGIVDARLGRKLVVRLEAAHPELIDYQKDKVDGRNRARSEPKHVRALLQEMARSPVFPRSVSDFELQTGAKNLKSSESLP
jgi:arylsulfatase A-like enzyme